MLGAAASTLAAACGDGLFGDRGGPPIRVMGCNFFDPDGTFIELNQILG